MSLQMIYRWVGNNGDNNNSHSCGGHDDKCKNCNTLTLVFNDKKGVSKSCKRQMGTWVEVCGYKKYTSGVKG